VGIVTLGEWLDAPPRYGRFVCWHETPTGERSVNDLLVARSIVDKDEFYVQAQSNHPCHFPMCEDDAMAKLRELAVGDKCSSWRRDAARMILNELGVPHVARRGKKEVDDGR